MMRALEHRGDPALPGEADSMAPIDFVLPAGLEAGEPPEARGLARDEVRLLVSYRSDDAMIHARFRDLPEYLMAGDVLIINTSGTLNAALPACRTDGTPLELHLSTHLPGDLWIVELRQPHGEKTHPFLRGTAGENLDLPHGARVQLLTPYSPDRARGPHEGEPVRLWIATLELPAPLHPYLAAHGFPIRYGYVRRRWPSRYYQTVYATEPGSAEMPSAGRAFTPQLITRLVACGVQVVPLLLHTGVASLEEHEQPYEEFYRVPPETARAVNAARSEGRRVIAVGTTVVRALETVADRDGKAHPGEGGTRLVIMPSGGMRCVGALLTGFHEPRASHLAMLDALASRSHVRRTYAEALRGRYLWHEFGDLHLILPARHAHQAG
jgi:S-adenosylmethionine:tRNA ribosyltransferase-isomerase